MSAKTTVVRIGRTPRYDDVASDDGFFEYRFQGDDPHSRDNRGLRETWEDRSPFIYFRGITAGHYSALFPCFVEEWNAFTLSIRFVVGSEEGSSLIVRESADLRRYSTVDAKMRLHQAAFRELVLEAYGKRCAISGLPEPRLIKAAHILPDRDVRGQPVVSNGLALSSLHHDAFDANLIGIDPNGVIHVNRELLEMHDGPTLKVALQDIAGGRIRHPQREEERPNREYLAERFEQFKATAA